MSIKKGEGGINLLAYTQAEKIEKELVFLGSQNSSIVTGSPALS